jgi:hypothetical protein
MAFFCDGEQWALGKQCNRFEVIEQVVLERIKRADQYMRGHRAGDHRVAVCRRPHRTANAEAPVRASHILDDDRLTKCRPYPLG